MEQRKICIVTGTRAEWGLLSGVARSLQLCPDVDLQIIATNMHLMPQYGETWREIERDGCAISYRVPCDAGGDSPTHTVTAMSLCMKGMAEAFQHLKPHLVVILGDRYEMLAVASAALISQIPIAHIAGGETTQGAYDESIRHAITKMSHLHFTENEEARKRVIQLGENPSRVMNVGALGVYNVMHTHYLSRNELENSLGISIPEKSLLATFHPATLDKESPAQQCRNLLAALDRFPDYKVIFTYPNNDTHGTEIIALLKDYAQAHPHRVALFNSLGLTRYLSMLRCVKAAIGNSSSGIIEVPSMHIPSLNIGIRQKGRLAAQSVVNCGVSVAEITEGLTSVLSPEMQEFAKSCPNPYEQPDTIQQIVTALRNTNLEGITIKPFFDL